MGANVEHFVVVGLGNPGAKYELTRHNIGAMVAQALAQEMNLSFKEEKKFHSLVAKGVCAGAYGQVALHMLMPLTYMNDSGRAVKAYLEYYRLKPTALLVLSDDVELPFMHLRYRSKGGSGGHNGLKSIESALGTNEYARLKFGVGKGLDGRSLADYVLENFNPAEMAEIPLFIRKGVDYLRIRLGVNHDNKSTESI
jgi:PTH1 family peptidyl-tRNA hydrolase